MFLLNFWGKISIWKESIKVLLIVLDGHMKFRYLADKQIRNGAERTLAEEFRSGHSIGAITVGTENIFIKRGIKLYFMPYADTDRIFRRVRSLHANICCGDGDIEVEYLVVMHKGKEIAEITLPDRKSAKMLMEELKAAAPETDFTAPAAAPANESE